MLEIFARLMTANIYYYKESGNAGEVKCKRRPRTTPNFA